MLLYSTRNICHIIDMEMTLYGMSAMNCHAPNLEMKQIVIPGNETNNNCKTVKNNCIICKTLDHASTI